MKTMHVAHGLAVVVLTQDPKIASMTCWYRVSRKYYVLEFADVRPGFEGSVKRAGEEVLFIARDVKADEFVFVRTKCVEV